MTGASQRPKCGHRIARGAIDPEQHELITRQQGKDGQGLRQYREYPQTQSKMRGPARHQGECERMLPEHHALITSSASPATKARVSPPVRGDSMDR